MVRELAQRLMAAEADALTGAGWGEVSAERVNHRNGYRQRPLDAGPYTYVWMDALTREVDRATGAGLRSGRQHEAAWCSEVRCDPGAVPQL